MDDFDEKNRSCIAAMGKDESLRHVSREWFQATYPYDYSYHFTWLGRPIIQYPQDIVAVQEIIWKVRPELIVETGIARGGSLILSASILELLGGKGIVLGIDIDIREHNRVEIEKHPLYKRIKMIQGSSVAEETFREVKQLAAAKSVLVILDSNHTHEHVSRELELYSTLVRKGSYLIVFDTVVEELPKELCRERPWGPGDNPMTAVHAFLKDNDRFEVDQEMQNKLLITAGPNGYLRCVKG
jgi:cephalosporin hydroxylase